MSSEGELPMEVPPSPGDKKGADWREHTAERWLRDDPEGYEHCKALVRMGNVNQSELGRYFGRSRHSVRALMLAEFNAAEIEDIIKKSAMLATAQGLDKVSELTDKATATKDLGGVAIALTTAHNIKQLATGGPTKIEQKTVRFSWEDVAHLQQKASPGRTVIDVPAMIGEGERVPVDVSHQNEFRPSQEGCRRAAEPLTTNKTQSNDYTEDDMARRE